MDGDRDLSYQQIFEILYDTVHVDNSDPKRTFLHFPLRQLREINPDTPAPLFRKHERDCLTEPPEIDFRKNGHSKPLFEALTFKGTRLGSHHGRVTIPILIRPGTGEYVIPPNTVIRSFDDLERWLIQFCQKFTLRPGESSSSMVLKSINSYPESDDDTAEMTYEIDGVNVELWNSIENARAFFAIFAPPKMSLHEINIHLLGLESIFEDVLNGLNAHFFHARSKAVVHDGDLEKVFRALLGPHSVVDLRRALLDLCDGFEANDLSEGKKLIMLSALLRKISPNLTGLDGMKDSPLCSAVKLRNYAVMKILLDHGADMTVRDTDHRTCLHIAAGLGDLTALRLLLEHPSPATGPVNVNVVDPYLRTPLMEAAKSRSLGTVRLLVEHGANVAARDIQNKTPLHYLVKGGFDSVIGAFLVEQGCPEMATDSLGVIASTYAAQKSVVFDIPERTKKTSEIQVMEKHLDLSFSTYKHRSSQGIISMDITDVTQRPVFHYQFGLTIKAKSETYIQLRPSSGWPVPYCQCAGPCKTCACVRVANRGSMVFTSRGLLLPDFPDSQPIVMCTAFCRCSKSCKVRSLSDTTSPRMEIFHDDSSKTWRVRTLDELERGQFVTFLGGEILHPDLRDDKKPWRYLLFSRAFCVDISRRANCSRFFLDSSLPNLRCVLVKEFDHTKPPQIAFFAAEWIAQGEVLAYDKASSFTHVQQALRDHCFAEYRFCDI